MLNNAQRWIVFMLFCLIVLACAAMECFEVYWDLHEGFSIARAIWELLFGGVLVGSGHLFIKLFSSTFLKQGITISRVHEFASERCNIVEDARNVGRDIYQTRRNLVTNTLRFCEECVQGWIPGSHFELCVFVDQEQPLLFAYFDSNHDSTARSMKARERNPRFYIERGYEVTRLLLKPTSQPRILKDTTDAKANYVFTSDEQRKQLKSSILVCLDVSTPCALVLSSNKKNAFSESESEVTSFIKYVGETVRFDLIEEGFIHQIRRLKPHLFSAI
jgi:hypothetical protein